ncbi:MAG: alkane 1-monooxygenase [Alphaproteobacteria bacterium]|nr:alkane 1-monooxygenase [Alphaproteobacteria bacterium]
MGALRYTGPFLFALSIPIFFYGIDPSAPLLTIALLLLVLIGAEAASPRGAAPVAPQQTPSFRALPVLYVPVQLTLIAWATVIAPHTTALGFTALALSVGVTTGVFGVLASHELIHGDDRVEHALGLAMLTAMTYRHFRVAHIFGHHRHAATERDPASARCGENFYAFLIRTVTGQFADAWRIESRRIAARGLPNWQHRSAADIAIMAILYVTLATVIGPRAAALFAGQSIVGIVVLELFNYIAHYGLMRRGRERLGDHHSWNSSNVVANALIFNMGRHASHHTHPTASYQDLMHIADAPELPAGYAGSILLALFPPLWRRVMDPAVQSLHTDRIKAPA